jgi:hypothetical protein
MICNETYTSIRSDKVTIFALNEYNHGSHLAIPYSVLELNVSVILNAFSKTYVVKISFLRYIVKLY